MTAGIMVCLDGIPKRERLLGDMLGISPDSGDYLRKCELTVMYDGHPPRGGCAVP